MDAVSIVVTIVVVILMLAVSFYMYTIYCHPQDKGVGSTLSAKIIIIIGQALAWGQILIIPLDVSNNFDGSSMNVVYQTLYIIIFVFSAFIIPFTVFLYEADQQDSLQSRILWSILFALGITSIWSAFIFISYIWLSKFTQDGITTQISVPLYMMVCLAFVGWLFLAVNGSVGLIFLPYELIKDFFVRPKQISKEQAYEKKKTLQEQSDKLIQMGQKLKKKQEEFKNEKNDLNWFKRRKRQSQIKSQLRFFKEEVSKLEDTFNIFDEELGGIKPPKNKKKGQKIEQNDKDLEKAVENKKTSPIFYCLSLFFGILASIVSIVWMIQLFGTTVQSNQKPIFTFLDPMMESLSEGSVSFIAVGIYSLMTLYMQGCTVKGNIVFGLRIPFILNLHPMKKDRTYLNTFLFNVNLMMLGSAAITEMTVITFPQYLGKSFLATFFRFQAFKLPMFGWIFSNRIFMAIFCIVTLMSLFIMIYQIVRECLAARKRGKKQV